MKRYNGLYEQICDFENIEIAYRKARRNKRYRNEVLRFTRDKEENLINIHNLLVWELYEIGPYRTFIVTVPKRRLIAALPFRDRVVQHAIMNVVEPILDKRMYYHSHACRKGHGMHAASDMLTRWIRNLTFQNIKVYALKCDIKQFFASINHHILKAQIRRIFKDDRLVRLLDKIIGSNGSEVGIPVGNLTSQFFANLYLDPLDKFVKEVMRERYYIRYMDDFIILGHDAAHLLSAQSEIEVFVQTHLALSMNPKTTIVCAANGVDFCGYIHYHDHKKIRRSNVKRMKRKIKSHAAGNIPDAAFSEIVNSWMGHISHADTYELQKKLLGAIIARTE